MFDFATPIDRHGTWCTQWDYVADRFGAADLLPFTISDMDFRHRALYSRRRPWRLAHGVFGYSRWRNEAFLGAIVHWYASRFNSDTSIRNLWSTDRRLSTWWRKPSAGGRRRRRRRGPHPCLRCVL
ncbi:hypothetical protein MJ584_12825 [Klebsiella pneumoniae]|nr:hypothetical protein MJ584_12825 [Klebsiella pneumoniae]